MEIVVGKNDIVTIGKFQVQLDSEDYLIVKGDFSETWLKEDTNGIVVDVFDKGSDPETENDTIVSTWATRNEFQK